MADISSIKLPSGNTYDIKDSTARASLNGKVDIAGDTMTGALIAPSFQTGSTASNYFQSQKFRGEGAADTYYHAIDFGYSGHNQVDFYEYGGVWNFHKHTAAAVGSGDTLVGKISSNGWEGSATLTGTPTAPTAAAGTNNTQIATTAFVNTALNAKATKTVLTATIAAADWTGSDPYTNTVTVSGLLATDTPTMDLVASSTYATAQNEIADYAYIYKATCSANTLTVYATQAPSVDLSVQLVCVR